jgi:hypothetical protein
MEKIKLRNLKKNLGTVLLFLVALFAGTAPGVADETEKITIPLTKLSAVGTMDLKGSQSTYVLKVPIPDRWRIKGAVLHLSYVNSSALLPQRSKLVVRLDGHVLAQVTLQALSPRGEVDVALPTELLRPGYNDLEFFVSQSNAERCTDPVAPELWTTLELDKSHLALDYHWEKVPMALATVSDFLFDPKLVGLNVVHIALEDFSEDNLYLAALAASGVAIRFEYRPVHFTLSSELTEGVDNLVIGSREFVTKLFQDLSPSVTTALLGVSPLPTEVEEYEGGELIRKTVPDPTHAMICISGSNHEEVLRATQAFSLLSYPLPDARYAKVDGVSVPEVSRYSGKVLLTPGERYIFRDLGFSTATFQGLRPAHKDLAFRIPSDVLIKPNEYAVLSMHLAYGSEMRRDSVVNIILNGKFATAIPLDDEKGGRFQGYRVSLPSYLLKRGYNTVTFAPVLTPLETGECIFLQTENLRMTLYDDSWIEVPAMNHWIGMPEIAAFFQDGFPFAKWPDWRETTVVLMERGAQPATAAINLLTMICQKTGIQPFEIRFAYDMGKGVGRELLMVSSIAALPSSILQNSPIAPETPYPFFGELPRVKKAKSWWKKLEKKVFPTEQPYLSEPEVISGRVHLTTKLGAGRLLLTEFQSPYDEVRTALLVSAETNEGLLRGALALWEPSVQAACREDLVIVELDGPDFKTYTQKVGKTYYVGKIGPFNRLDYLSHNYPLAFFGTLFFSLLVLAFILHRVLKRFRAKRVEHD